MEEYMETDTEDAIVHQEASTSEYSASLEISTPDMAPSSWNYQQIFSNIFHGDVRDLSSTVLEAQCSCLDGTAKCSTTACPNRAMCVECPSTCGVFCKNRKIQNREWVPGLQRKMTKDKGFGIFTTNQIKEGEFIAEYVGEIVSSEEFQKRMKTIYNNDRHFYCFDLENGYVIDGHRVGNELRFVNHGCDPNCNMMKWSVHGLPRLGLFARRNIEPDEELCYDYKFVPFNETEAQPCHCGSDKCRGTIGVPAMRRDSSWELSKNPQASSSGSIEKKLVEISQEKMKPISKKSKDFIVSNHCFLISNYEKLKQAQDEEQAIGDKLEKLIKPWTLRYKPGSLRNIPLQIPDDDPKLARLARRSEMLYEFFVKLTMVKDSYGSLLCEPIVNLSSRSGSTHQSTTSKKNLDFTEIVRKIIRGEYLSISSFEVEMRKIFSFYENFNPEMKKNGEKIDRIFEDLQVEAMNRLGN